MRVLAWLSRQILPHNDTAFRRIVFVDKFYPIFLGSPRLSTHPFQCGGYSIEESGPSL